MTKQEAIESLRENYCCNRSVCELHSVDLCQKEKCEIWMAISALQEQEEKTQLSAEGTTSDLISRQAVIALANSLKDDLPDDERIADTVMVHNEGILEYQTKLSLLPSAQPEIEERTEEFAQNVPKEDSISRKAAIEALGERPMVWTDNDQYALGERNQYDMNRLAIETLPSVQPEPQWIPVSERLPEEDHWLGGSGKQFSDNVLVSILNSDDEDEWVDISQTIDGKWALELPRHCKITAWMPLPEPYRAERRTDAD